MASAVRLDFVTSAGGLAPLRIEIRRVGETVLQTEKCIKAKA